MAGVLEALAQGLRGAGGTLSPEAFKAMNEEDAQSDQLKRQIQLYKFQQDLAGINEKLLSTAVGPYLEKGDLQGAAAAAAKSGVPGSSQFALKLTEQDEARKSREGIARENREARAMEVMSRLEQAAQSQQQLHEARMSNARTNEERLLETKRHNSAIEGLNARANELLNGYRQQGVDIRRLMLELQGDRLDAQRRDRHDRDVENMSKRFGGDSMLTSLMTSVDRVNSLVSPYIEQDEAGNTKVKKGGIPGIGYGTTIGGAQFALTPEGKKNRAAVQGAANDLLKLYSGGAVTLSEEQRRMVEMMASGSYSAQDFVSAWPLIVDRLNAAVSNIRAGYDPSVAQTYRARGGVNIEERTPFNLPKRGGGGDQEGPVFEGYRFPSQEALDRYKAAKGVK